VKLTGQIRLFKLTHYRETPPDRKECHRQCAAAIPWRRRPRIERPDAGASEIRNRPGIIDQASGEGRVILFAGNPCYRWQNFGEFNLLFNLVLNYNDISAAVAPKAAASERNR
jgi:hypothetical protein